MATTLEIGRARSDIDVISRAGLPIYEFMDEATAAIEHAVPFVAACIATLDPETVLVSGVRKWGALDGRNESDVAWAQLEYDSDDPTTFAAMLSSGSPAIALHAAMAGDVERSARMSQLMIPGFDFHDEARLVLTDRGGAWGAISIFRGSDDEPFTAEEVAFLESIGPAYARGIRAGMLAQLSRTRSAPETGPAVVIVDGEDRIVQSSPGAAAQLERLAQVRGAGDPLTLVYSLVSGARRVARGEVERMPRIRVRTTDGVWLVLHASPLSGTIDRAGDVVVTIEEARPQEVIDLVAAVFGLTVREREVTAMVLRGADTREIAASIHVSPYTVQDHLKSVFEKAGVTSRRELVSRVYFDQYAPRIGEELGAGGWFAGTPSPPRPR